MRIGHCPHGATRKPWTLKEEARFPRGVIVATYGYPVTYSQALELVAAAAGEFGRLWRVGFAPRRVLLPE